VKKLTIKALLLSLLILSTPNIKCFDSFWLLIAGIPIAGGIVGAVIAETAIFVGHKVKQCVSSLPKKRRKTKKRKNGKKKNKKTSNKTVENKKIDLPEEPLIAT